MQVSALAKANVWAVIFGVHIFLPVVFMFPQRVLAEEVIPVTEEFDTEIESEALHKTIDDEKPTTDFSVTPVVANEKAKPRDIIKKELLVTNNTNERVDLYITVENVDPEQGAEEFQSAGTSDLSTSLANWVEITRGVIELTPGESRKIPYLIHVNLSAKPGSYYARIQFKQGPVRETAEKSIEGSELLLNIEVEDDANERLQLGNFISEKSVVLGDSVSFSYLLENVGNRLIEPRGSIRIFNRRGEEVGSVPLNAEGEEITPENKRQLATVWSASGRFGKYKAFLDLEYGENQLASVQDTVYFWVFPWKEILVSLFGVVVLAVVGTYIVHMRSIAQPVYARRKENVTRGEEEYPVYSKSHTQYVPLPRVRTQSHMAHVTVLQSAQSRRQEINSRQDKHIYIKHNEANKTQPHKFNGNVVQLSSRR
jgi:hypothetical protein